MSERNEHPEVRFETSDVSPRRILLFALGIGLLLLLILAALWGFYGGRLRSIQTDRSDLDADSFTYGPDWEDRVTRQREALWKLERERLTTTAWIDREQGVLRVPIDAVLDSVSDDGVPVWGPVETPENSPFALSTDNE